MDDIDILTLIRLAFDRGTLRRLTFSRPVGEAQGAAIRISGRMCEHKGKRLLALEYVLPGDTVAQRNLPPDEMEGVLSPLVKVYRQVNLSTGEGDAEWKANKSGHSVLLGGEKLLKKLTRDEVSALAPEMLNREKHHLLTGREDFLIRLGISDSTGRVHDKRQGKFRQIDRFLTYLEEIYPSRPTDGRLTVYDLCCGKSYLSFAVYYDLTVRHGREVDMYGIDRKEDVIAFCAGMAQELRYTGMHFSAGDIRTDLPEGAPDLVISLHACDTATDLVLETAIARGAKVILSTPCCHRALAARLSAPELAFVSDYPYLLHKLGEPLTDALRLLRLAAAGYRVSATELVDPEDTPKNTLLRAVYTGHRDPVALMRYRAALTFLFGDGAEAYQKEVTGTHE